MLSKISQTDMAYNVEKEKRRIVASTREKDVYIERSQHKTLLASARVIRLTTLAVKNYTTASHANDRLIRCIKVKCRATI